MGKNISVSPSYIGNLAKEIYQIDLTEKEVKRIVERNKNLLEYKLNDHLIDIFPETIAYSIQLIKDSREHEAERRQLATITDAEIGFDFFEKLSTFGYVTMLIAFLWISVAIACATNIHPLHGLAILVGSGILPMMYILVGFRNIQKRRMLKKNSYLASKKK